MGKVSSGKSGTPGEGELKEGTKGRQRQFLLHSFPIFLAIMGRRRGRDGEWMRGEIPIA